ncbi:MAG: fibrobacter succinogenes major paralogous domain-containing protein [Bacteroidia bacterium]|nr:fibrobacter succinogenes major paralogous domain-containing protein [Bacteroidia bacterium]
MKKIYATLYLLTIFIVIGHAQNLKCAGDTFDITLAGYYQGAIQWEQSSDSVNWTPITDADSIVLVQTATVSKYFRAKVTNGSCPSIFSDIFHILVVQPPSTADAGLDQFITNNNHTTIHAQNVSTGQGHWSLLNGAGGSFQYADSATTEFNGLECGAYTLLWSVENSPCPVSVDTVIITFQFEPSASVAGQDQADTGMCGLTATTLNATSPTVGTGAWSIVSGSGGSFNDTLSVNAVFSGIAGSIYVLRWTTTNGNCPPKTDDMIVRFRRNPSVAEAGPDQIGSGLCGLTSATLAATVPLIGTGHWSVLSGTGTISNPLVSNTAITGSAGDTLILQWTVQNDSCPSSSDQVIIIFQQNPTVAAAGADHTGAETCGDTSFVLNANIPTVGSGIWSVVSGTGGSFSDSSQNNTTFYGLQGNAYTLRWTIINIPCPVSSDDVNITFNENPSTADAGADQPAVNGTSTTLTANNPLVGSGSWSIVSGSGGTVAQPANPGSSFTGIYGNSYRLVWTIANPPCPSSEDTVKIIFFLCGTLFTDYRDGRYYNSLQLGIQCWMGQNLNYGDKVNTNITQMNNPVVEKYCYNNDTNNCNIYGGLYQWAEMVQYLNGASNIASWNPVPTGNVQGICPAGWHLPSDSEWQGLVNYLGGDTVAGGKLKETGLTHWNSPNTGADNSSNFTALGAGQRAANTILDFKNIAYFWTITEYGIYDVWYRALNFNDAAVTHDKYAKNTGRSVRCLRD